MQPCPFAFLWQSPGPVDDSTWLNVLSPSEDFHCTHYDSANCNGAFRAHPIDEQTYWSGWALHHRLGLPHLELAHFKALETFMCLFLQQGPTKTRHSIWFACSSIHKFHHSCRNECDRGPLPFSPCSLAPPLLKKSTGTAVYNVQSHSNISSSSHTYFKLQQECGQMTLHMHVMVILPYTSWAMEELYTLKSSCVSLANVWMLL